MSARANFPCWLVSCDQLGRLDFTHNANEEIAFLAGIPRLYREESQKRVGGVETNWIHGWRHARAFAGSINRAVRYISHPAVPVRLSWTSTLYLRGDAPRLTERRTLSGRPVQSRSADLHASGSCLYPTGTGTVYPSTSLFPTRGFLPEKISSDIDLSCQATCSSFRFRLGDLSANFLNHQILSCPVWVREQVRCTLPKRGYGLRCLRSVGAID